MAAKHYDTHTFSTHANKCKYLIYFASFSAGPHHTDKSWVSTTSPSSHGGLKLDWMLKSLTISSLETGDVDDTGVTG